MDASSSSSSSPAPKRERGAALGILFVLALIALVVVLDLRRREAEKKLMDLSMKYEQVQGADQAQNREAAKEIIQKVKQHMVLPSDVEPTVAKIVDVNQLRSRNAFYNKAKNGDYLIVLPERAILFDPVADKIVDVVPVQIQPTPQAAPEGQEAPPQEAQQEAQQNAAQEEPPQEGQESSAEAQ